MAWKQWKKIYGDIGEEIARRELERAGYSVLERNFRARHGEIDLIARQGDVLVMVEVKTRDSARFGEAEEAVDAAKARHIAQAATEYLRRHPEFAELPVRLDVVAITLNGEEEAQVRLYPNALDLGDYYF